MGNEIKCFSTSIIKINDLEKYHHEESGINEENVGNSCRYFGRDDGECEGMGDTCQPSPDLFRFGFNCQETGSGKETNSNPGISLYDNAYG